MSRTLVLMVTLFGSGMLACVGAGFGSSCIPAGTSIAVSRTNGSGDCAAPVVAGVATLNGSETFMPAAAVSCGVVHFNLTVNFFQQDAALESCHGTDVLMLADLGSGGGSGSDTMTITCAGSPACTETFDVTLTPQ